MRRLMIKAPSVKEPYGRSYAGFRWVVIPMMGDISAHMHFAARLQLLTTGLCSTRNTKCDSATPAQASDRRIQTEMVIQKLPGLS